MPRIAYVNGRYLAQRDAEVNIEDRGFQFADGCYEVVAIRNGVFIDAGLHLQRLHRSLDGLSLHFAMSDAALTMVMREVAQRNRVREGFVYLQITRGVAARDFAFPGKARPTLVMTARSKSLIDPKLLEGGVKVITIPEQRWARPDIKSVSLLPNALGKEQAKQAGAFEAWQVDQGGHVTEGTSSNAWIVTKSGEVVTRQADHGILNGVTRQGLLRVLAAAGLRVSERPFTVAEAKAAAEAFLTSSTNFVLPVVAIDDTPIGNGHPGSTVERLAALYLDYAAKGGADKP